MKKIFLTLFSLMLFNFNVSYALDPNSIAKPNEVRYMEPLKLDDAHLGKRVTCYRPMREGSPRMDIIKLNNKIIANNYGHGGAGWTLAPGSASYVVSLVEKEIKQNQYSKKEPITVIGAGAMGLFSTLALVEKGYKNITLVAENFEDLTSHKAGGLFGVASMNNDLEMTKLIDKIAIESAIFFKNIANQKNKNFKEGVRIIPSYFENREDSELESYVGVVIEPAKDVILDFGNGVTRKMVVYDDNIFMDTEKLMILIKDFLKDKVKFVKKKVENFAEIKDKIIINCTGNGAKQLSGDDKMISVQGHLIMLKNQDLKNMNHMLSIKGKFGEHKTKAGADVKRSFYAFPKPTVGGNKNDIGVIGGTFIENTDSSTPNEEEFDILIKRARDFYGIK